MHDVMIIVIQRELLVHGHIQSHAPYKIAYPSIEIAKEQELHMEPSERRCKHDVNMISSFFWNSFQLAVTILRYIGVSTMVQRTVPIETG